MSLSDIAFFSASWAHAFPHDLESNAAGTSFQPGEDLLFSLSYLHYFSLKWSLGGSVDYRLITRARLDGEQLERSAGRQLSLGVQASYFLAWPSLQIR